jgi:hypothetical protein
MRRNDFWVYDGVLAACRRGEPVVGRRPGVPYMAEFHACRVVDGTRQHTTPSACYVLQ